MTQRILNNVDTRDPNIQIYGNPDVWVHICKAWNLTEGWFKSTKAMLIYGYGCLVQTSTQQKNADGSWAGADCVVPVPGAGLLIHRAKDGTILLAKIVQAKGGMEGQIEEHLTAGAIEIPTAFDPTDNPLPPDVSTESSEEPESRNKGKKGK